MLEVQRNENVRLGRAKDGIRSIKSAASEVIKDANLRTITKQVADLIDTLDKLGLRKKESEK